MNAQNYLSENLKGRDHRSRWEKKFKVDFKETGFKVEDWIHLNQNRSQQQVHVTQ
jgi:hypothetical protein